MASVFQQLQQRIAQKANRIEPPSFKLIEFQALDEPTVGWISREDYELKAPESWPLIWHNAPAPRQASQSLPIPADTADPLPPAWEQIDAPSFGSTTLLAPPDTFDCLLEPRVEIYEVTQVALLFSKVMEPPLALLNPQETKRLRQILPDAAVNNINVPLAIVAGCSADLFRAFRLSQSFRTADCVQVLYSRTAVSEDLFRPLLRRARADGKHYQTVPQDSSQPAGPQRPILGAFPGNRKAILTAHGNSSRRVARGMSVWDLIFPLFQCPVNLEFGSVVDLPSSLYVFQTKGVEFLVERHSALLGDDMGTGKTVQTAVALRILFQKAKVKSALIVCPLSVIPNWDRELAKWAPNLAVTVVRGAKEHRTICWRQRTHIWLTTYDTLRNDAEVVQTVRLGEFDAVIADEAHRIKNWNAGVSKAIRQLRADYKWGLTGTPLENRLEDVFAIFGFIQTKLFESRVYHEEEVKEAIKPYFLRRRKQDVLTDLPELVQTDVWLHLEDEQCTSYETLERDGVLQLHALGGAITVHHIIVLLNKLKQVCNRCPKSGQSSKLVWLKDSLEEIVAEGDKALIFSHYAQERLGGAAWLEHELAQYRALNYGNATTEKQRIEILAAFQNQPECRVFIGHPKTAGLGLNELVVANYVVHFDHWWNPAVMNQATARAHRPGQKKTVFAYNLWVSQTYEEIIFNHLVRKQSLYDRVIDSLSADKEVPSAFYFGVGDALFSKYGLKPVQRKSGSLEVGKPTMNAP